MVLAEMVFSYMVFTEMVFSHKMFAEMVFSHKVFAEMVFSLFYFLCGLRPFLISLYTIFPLGVLYLEHLQLVFDFVIIACSLESTRPGLVQGCKAPNFVG